jgi:hypothetical protein
VVEDAPLAFCDPRSLAWDDLVEIDSVADDCIGVIYFLNHNSQLVRSNFYTVYEILIGFLIGRDRIQ